jgi:hypothetical protein
MKYYKTPFVSTNMWKLLWPQKVLTKIIDNALNTCDPKYVLAIRFLRASLSHGNQKM